MSMVPASTIPAPAYTRHDAAPLPADASPQERLTREPQTIDFYQAVRLLEQLFPARQPVGHTAAPEREAVRFGVPLSAAFPASSIADLQLPVADDDRPRMTVAFMGLTGPSGVLPAHYSELLVRLARDVRGPEKHALRAWLDLFNHRAISLFYRAWEKYRPWVAYARGEYQQPDPDVFTSALFSLAGLASLKRTDEPGIPLAYRLPHCLVRYAGLLAHRPRNVANLQALLADYFGLPVAIEQFCGQWIALDSQQQSRLGTHGVLGVDAVVGANVWDRQSKIRVSLGPLTREEFDRLLPEPAPDGSGPRLAEILAVVRFYLKGETDFDVQLVLRVSDVPACQLASADQAICRLGWNTWLASGQPEGDRRDAIFAA